MSIQHQIKMEFDGNNVTSPIPIPAFISPLSDPFDLLRHRGSSNTSWRSNRSFNFGTITPLNIPPVDNGMIIPKEESNIDNNNQFSPAIDTKNYNTNDFVRSAPVYGGLNNGSELNTWDQVISFNSPTNNNNTLPINVEDPDQLDLNNHDAPDFMKSNFFIPDTMPPFSRAASIESMSSLIDPNQPAPQSAPSKANNFGDDWDYVKQEPISIDNKFTQNIFTPISIPPSNTIIPPAIITEDDIFGSVKSNRNRNWSEITTESENAPIIHTLSGNKRQRNRSLSHDTATIMPPTQKLKRNINDHSGIPPMFYNNAYNSIPPSIEFANTRSITPTIIDGVNEINIQNDQSHLPLKRGRGRPRKYKITTRKTKKISTKYDGLSKAEREKLRRRELKEGYSELTEMLGLMSRKGALLPDRSLIIAKTCEEIKRLEQRLFELSMKK